MPVRSMCPAFLQPTSGSPTSWRPGPGSSRSSTSKEGEVVEKGAPLISVNVEQTSENGGGIDSATLASLHQQRQRLDDQIALERQQSTVETQRLQTELAGLQSELATIDQQRKLQVQRTTIVHDQMGSYDTLAKQGVVSQVEQKKRQDAYLSAQAAQLDLDRTYAERQKELSLRRSDLAQLPISSQQRVSQLQASIDEIDMKTKQTDGQRGYLITAPKAGRVSSLQAWVGKTAEPNIPQMSIVPEGDTLTAELFVPMRAIGFVAPGQDVHLSYTSFPYQQFGFADGTVETVSHTLLRTRSGGRAADVRHASLPSVGDA